MVCRLTALAVFAAGMWFAGAAPAAAQQGDFNAPDLVLINGKVLTLDERSTVTEAVAVRDGRILATGGSASIKSLAGARTRVLMRDVYPDSHDNYHGIAQQTPERLKQLVSICNRYGWRVGVHVVGDLGIDQVLDALESADKEKSIRDRRFVLIHASLIRPEQMERAHSLGVRIDFQNVFMWDKAATVERFLGRATADRAVPTRTLIAKMGLDSLGAGTDFPVNPINPFLNMYIMGTRKDPNGSVYGASEAISREQALRLYTSAASHYTFEEARKGTIEPGKLADLVVLSADYMAVPEAQIRDIKADMTLIGGKVVFER